MDYKSSGVDVKAGEAAVKAIKNVVKQTYNQNVLSELGSFGGLYKLDQNQWKQPILVASTDGVGTKIKVAIMAGIYDTIGQDLVNHCVNDILVQGAHPQVFLDYIGLSGMDTAKVETIIGGLVKACSENSCALIGGEMAEMPGIYHADDFDLVGTIIGFVEKDRLIPREIAPGAVLLGFPSTGLHTNGYSLARKIVFEHLGLKVDSYVQELGMTVAETLLSIHKSYYQVLLPYLANQALWAWLTSQVAASRVISSGLSLRTALPRLISSIRFRLCLPGSRMPENWQMMLPTKLLIWVLV
jgi:phosphoribosylformylglycinamidine cyclo-ligase